MRYSLDANVIRSIGHGDSGSAALLVAIDRAGSGNCGISSIVAFELHRAALSHRLTRASRQVISGYLESFTVLAFDGEDARAAAELEREIKGNLPGEKDIMIAAQARRRGLLMVTDNVKHFSRVTGLVVENWLRP